MAFRVKEIDFEGEEYTFIEESYENEIAQAFLDADYEAGEEVDVIYIVDDLTGEDIECWRKDYIIVKD